MKTYTIKELMEESELLNEESVGKGASISIPKFVPNESWGDLNEGTRGEVDIFFKAVEGKTLEEKLKYIERLQAGLTGGKTKITSPRRILSTLVVLETLSAVSDSFSASSAGLVFEGFVSGLIGGSSASRLGKEHLDTIIDVFSSEGAPLSIKLIKPETGVLGSYKSLVETLNKYKSVQYIVAWKKPGDIVVISSFHVTRGNFIELMNLTKPTMLRYKDGRTREQIRELKKMPWETQYEFLKISQGYRKEKRGTQFKITHKDLYGKLRGLMDFEEVATFRLSKDALRRTAEEYMKYLKKDMELLVTQMKELSENVNKYLSRTRRNRAISSAKKAIANTSMIEETLTNSISDGGIDE